MPRIKSTTANPLNKISDFEKCVDEIATLQLKIDADVAVYNEEKALAETQFKAQLKRDQERLTQKLSIAEMFAAHHRDQLLSDKQTGETKFSFFGYRKSPGIIKTLNSKCTIGSAIQALKDAGKKACIKVTETLDKQAVKREIPEAELPKYGLRMEHSEQFWIEPKRAEKPSEKRISA